MEKKILVVDDDLQIRSLLEKFLIKKGFYALSAASGEEALEKIKTAKPIIVLLDIKMPGMDGLMTLKRIKEINEDIGVIMITGVEDEDIGEVALKSGAYDYITKPLDLDYLEMCLLTKILLLSA
ncbi:MAG: response regulator [Candidatus Omnitrophota bacterium]|nr:response regulator [Candidatus Omnitrophota bacterium]